MRSTTSYPPQFGSSGGKLCTSNNSATFAAVITRANSCRNTVSRQSHRLRSHTDLAKSPTSRFTLRCASFNFASIIRDSSTTAVSHRCLSFNTGHAACGAVSTTHSEFWNWMRYRTMRLKSSASGTPTKNSSPIALIVGIRVMPSSCTLGQVDESARSNISNSTASPNSALASASLGFRPSHLLHSELWNTSSFSGCMWMPSTYRPRNHWWQTWFWRRKRPLRRSAVDQLVIPQP